MEGIHAMPRIWSVCVLGRGGELEKFMKLALTDDGIRIKLCGLFENFIVNFFGF